MKHFLKKDVRKKLISVHKKVKDKREADRIKAVILADEGFHYCEIARILLLDEQTISRHVHDYLDANKLTNDAGGSEPHLRAYPETLNN